MCHAVGTKIHKTKLHSHWLSRCLEFGAVSRNTAPARNIGLSPMKKDRIDVLRYENRYT